MATNKKNNNTMKFVGLAGQMMGMLAAATWLGWFIDKSHRLNGVSKWDAYSLYLNYHEGWTGYKRQTYRSKGWLMRTAERVKQRAGNYGAQLRRCEDDLQKNWFLDLFF